MGTIIPRKRADGTTGFSAQILVKVKGEIVHRETKTFDRRQAAAGWLENRERELKAPGAIDAMKAVDPTLGETIQRYVTESRKEIGRTKAQVLETICADPIGSIRCSAITSAEVTAFVKRRGAANQPQTVGNYLSHLSAVFAVARPAWGYPLDQGAMKDAQAVAKRMGYTSKSASRDRLPSLPELDLILSHFETRSIRNPAAVPMVKVVVFALFSTRRQEEITLLEWSDLDEAHSRILVRNMKHPGQKAGNDTWCDLPEPAMRVLLSMPRSKPRIFPYGTDAISSGFTRACQFLQIGDLRFHDLRHAGISRLAELGLSIPHMAAVSGHRSWTSLKRYTHIKQTGDRFADWPWIERAINPHLRP